MLDLVREIRQTLRNNRTRTVLTGLSVAWGIFMLIILLGVSRGVYNSFESNTANHKDRITVWGGYTSMPFKGYKDGRSIDLSDDDVHKVKNENRHSVERVIAYSSNDTSSIIGPKGHISGGFNAVYPEAMNSDEVKILHGRFINVPDMKEQRKVMVLHARNARLMFGDEVSALGKTVSSMGIAWTVVGIYDHRWRSQTYVPYSTLKGITGNGNEAYELEVTVRNISTLEEGEQAEKEIRATLARSHSFNPHDNNAVWIWNAFTQNITARRGLGYLDLAVWLIGLFTLLTGIVGVSNIMFVSVRERTHEIGIRRALGAKPRSILGQVVAESVAITSLFGYIGLVAGMVVLQIIDMLIGNSNDFKDPTVDVAMALKVTLALVVAGTMAGLFPAIKATKVKPVEALRDE